MDRRPNDDLAGSGNGSASGFVLPPTLRRHDAQVRRVGFEFEYAGLGVEDSAKLLQRLFGGRIERRNDFAFVVRDTAHGNFGVEIDFALLTDEKLGAYLAEIGVDARRHRRLTRSVEGLIARLTQDLIPCEIAMPPIPVTDLSPAQRVADSLRGERAEGTRSSMLNAFGLHINTELARGDADYLLAHIRASLLLFDWICAETGVDLTRRLLAFVQQYPGAYEDRVLDADYHPTLEGLIDDYLDLVGSRDYALDMLPAFAHLDRDRVMERAKSPALVKARPAFHFRLANSRVDEPGWRVADEWRYWVKIEEVAANSRLLADLAAARREYRSMLPGTRDSWSGRVAGMLGA